MCVRSQIVLSLANFFGQVFFYSFVFRSLVFTKYIGVVWRRSYRQVRLAAAVGDFFRFGVDVLEPVELWD
jgi:hypothetical protein